MTFALAGLVPAPTYAAPHEPCPVRVRYVAPLAVPAASGAVQGVVYTLAAAQPLRIDNARLMVLTAASVYAAGVPSITIDDTIIPPPSGSSLRDASAPFAFTLPWNESIRYAWIDRVAVGGVSYVCPPIALGYVAPKSPADRSAAGSLEAVRVATLIAAMPPPVQAVFVESVSALHLQCPNVFEHARVLRYFTPHTPDDARRLGALGTSQIAVEIEPDGSVGNTRVWVSSGNTQLDAIAANAARRTAYTPEQFLCQPTFGTYIFVVTFQ